MVDPLTALSVASTAVSQAKQLISAGRDATSALSKFAGAVSDINYASERAKNPSIWKSLTGSAEAEAVEVFAAQKKLQSMRREIETLIQYSYGQKGLEEYKNTLRSVKAQRQKVTYRKQELKELLIMWTVGSLAMVSGASGLIAVVYWLGKGQGKW